MKCEIYLHASSTLQYQKVTIKLEVSKGKQRVWILNGTGHSKTWSLVIVVEDKPMIARFWQPVQRTIELKWKLVRYIQNLQQSNEDLSISSRVSLSVHWR